MRLGCIHRGSFTGGACSQPFRDLLTNGPPHRRYDHATQRQGRMARQCSSMRQWTIPFALPRSQRRSGRRRAWPGSPTVRGGGCQNYFDSTTRSLIEHLVGDRCHFQREQRLLPLLIARWEARTALEVRRASRIHRQRRVKTVLTARLNLGSGTEPVLGTMAAATKRALCP